MIKERGNGSNLIVLNPVNEILVVRQNYGEKKWMIPGGEIEPGESPRHAAQEETEEESGIIVDENNMRLIALLVQRPNGLITLYETIKYAGKILEEGTAETDAVAFMSFQQIINRRTDFGLGYLRMIVTYQRCIRGFNKIPFEGRLSDQVEFPRVKDIYFEEQFLQI